MRGGHRRWRQALAAAARWRRAGRDLRVSLNCSARHTGLDRSPARLAALASLAGVPPAAVDVEITETNHLDLTGAGPTVLAELRDRGFPVILDDFGTGWSTIASLLDLPHDGLEVDRSLTRRSDTPTGRAALAAIAAAARGQGARTIAEGVETRAQAETVTELGYDHAQGYFWGRPAPEPA